MLKKASVHRFSFILFSPLLVSGALHQSWALAQVTRVGDIIYGPFEKQSNGILASKYTVDNSDIVGYGVAFDCVSKKVNMYAPNGMPSEPGVRWRWVGWEDAYRSEHQKMLIKQCMKFYTGIF
jgi:hypothetical protein